MLSFFIDMTETLLILKWSETWMSNQKSVS